MYNFVPIRNPIYGFDSRGIKKRQKDNNPYND
jgi:hypothetical protein